MFTLHTKNISEDITLRQLPTLRQSFIVASTLIIIGIILSVTVHQGFIALPLLVAGGLLFSGIVGFCPMAYFLQLLPWNKKRYAKASSNAQAGHSTR